MLAPESLLHHGVNDSFMSTLNRFSLHFGSPRAFLPVFLCLLTGFSSPNEPRGSRPLISDDGDKQPRNRSATLATPFQIALVQPVQLHKSEKSVAGFRSNLFYGKNPHVVGVDLGLVNHVSNDLGGIQLGLGNIVERQGKGFQFGFYNHAEEGFTGWQHGAASHSKGEFKGFQSSYVALTEGNLKGVQYGLWCETSGNFKGWQTGGLGAYVQGDLWGAQTGGILNVVNGKCKGVQIGIINIAGELQGIQIGMINVNQKGPLVVFPTINIAL
jgi:hypothetical protein